MSTLVFCRIPIELADAVPLTRYYSVSKLFERAQLRASRSNSVKLDLFTHCIVDSVERDEIKSEEGLERWNVRTNSKETISA